MSKTLRGLLVRTGIALLIVGGLYIGAVYIPRQLNRSRHQIPNAKLEAFRNAVDQNYLTFTALATIKVSDISSVTTLAQARGSLTDSMNGLKTALAHPPKQIGPQLKSDLQSILSTETTLAGQYDGYYSALSNPLFYNPAEDLTIDSETVTRANTAQQSLQKLGTENQINVSPPSDSNSSSTEVFANLPSDVRTALQNSASCIGTFSKQLSAKQNADAQKTLQSCVTGYNTTRKILTATIVAPLQSSIGHNIQTKLQADLKKIDTLIR